jgi:predicted amidohydrolase YtcJ
MTIPWMSMRPRRLYALLACAALALPPAAAYGQAPPPEVMAWADLVLYNTKVITADEQFTIAEAVAIRDGKFLAVGPNQRILAMAGPKTRKIDLAGRSIVPGFIDTHLHSAFVGNSGFVSARADGQEDRWDTLEAAIETIKKHVEAAKPGQTLALSSPSNDVTVNQLNVKLLDQLAPNNPLFVEATNDQVAANSLILKQIPPDTAGVLKDAQGQPTGQLRGGAAGIPVWDLQPWPAVESLYGPQKEEFKRYNAQGLTTIGGRTTGLAITLFRDLMLKDELTVRVRAIHELMRQNPTPEPYLKRVGNLTDFGNDWFKIIGTTVQVIDGTTGSGSGYTTFSKLKSPAGDPYPPTGQNKWEEVGDLKKSDRWNLILANRYGWRITGLHSSGDKSNDVILDAFAEAHKERSLHGRRFGIDHGEMWRPDQYAKIKELQVIPSLYSKALYSNDRLIEMYGRDRVDKMQPVRSMIDAGIRPAAEADARYPFSAPLFNITKWVTRIDDKGRMINKEEKIDRKEALYMYTLWAAAYSGEEKLIGSIEPGKLADLVVLGGDYMTFPETDLGKMPVVMTVVGGRIVHEVAGATGSSSGM